MQQPSDPQSAGPSAAMGAVAHDGGVAFRVWAPHAESVAVVGSFNDWSKDGDPMRPEAGGNWFLDVPGAKIGDQYRFLLRGGGREWSRIDPWAREVSNSAGNGIVHDGAFDWQADAFRAPPLNELVIYELHVGTFEPQSTLLPSKLEAVTRGFDHLRRLGVNAIEIMPVAEFAGDVSWGYNPACIFAVESSYGGPRALKDLVRAAHQQGLAVILDVVYNHFGPQDLGLWQFDGWSENNLGGIYFYNDWRAETPWGHTRPDYGREEVRRYIHENARMWLDEFHVDGLRFDMTLYIRTVRADGDPGGDLPDGWRLTQEINSDVRARYPGRFTIAEDLRKNEWLTKDVGAGGAGFSSQWDDNFVHPVRAAVEAVDDGQRSMNGVCSAIAYRYNDDAFERVIYSESHDEVANGKSRVPTEIDREGSDNWYAQKRSTLAAVLVFTSPGVPMLFEGQEFLQGGWFRDDVPLEWDLAEKFQGIVKLYRDLIRLRLDRDGTSRGLSGQGCNVYHVNQANDLLAFHRWRDGGPGDDVIVVVNFANNPVTNYIIGLPRPGLWKVRVNTDWNGYSPSFGCCPAEDLTTRPEPYDNHPHRAEVHLGPYTAIIYSQDATGRETPSR